MRRAASPARSSVKTKSAATAPIDIIVESPLWKAQRGARTAIRQAIAAAATMVNQKGELAVVLTDDAAIRTLNRTWRGKDTATNVLSFGAPSPPGAPRLLGDIVIAYETSAREALAEGKPFRHHLAHLAVHGYLHLAGHDHEADADAEAMERLEVAILKRLKVPDPYIARDAKG